MKKYLITGALALVASATFISCHTDDDFGGSIVEQKMQAYQEVFEEEFGKVDPNQDWGFGTAELLSRTRAGMAQARTRQNAADGNEWGAPTDNPAEYDRGWIVPDTLTDAQKLRVTRYFQTHPYLTYIDPHWTNFFVQQVYTGGTNVLTGNESYKNQVYDPSPEVYRSGDKLPTQDADITSDKLNWLFAHDEHINNFNAATASYKPVLETGEPVNGGKKHNDRINLMYHSSTYDFSYDNAYSSVRHGQPYVALVSAQVIDEWADSVQTACGITIGEPVYNGTSYSGKPNSYWNRSFLGCDLELLIGEEIYVNGYKDYSAPLYDGHWVDGYKYYKPETYGETYKYLKAESNQYGGDLRKYDNEPQGDELTWLLANGYLPRESSADKDWIKPLPVADHYYSDWIVTLTEAKRQNEIIVDPTSFSLRVMAEDLSATERSDYDFNDVVFDVVWKVGDNYATIYLKAAGGTLPLRIGSTDGEGGIEVHEQFGVQTNIMVNTHWAGTNGVDGKTAQPFTVPFSVTASNADAGITTADFNAAVNTQISVEVEKLVNSSTGEKKWFGLYANQGQVCCKFGCPTTYDWVSERTNIDRVYRFSDWVQGFTTTLLPANQTNN